MGSNDREKARPYRSWNRWQWISLNCAQILARKSALTPNLDEKAL
jgi:hypothetical protein